MTISVDKATENGEKVYRKLRGIGRTHAAAKRDAERWILDNYGVAVTVAGDELCTTVVPGLCGVCGQRLLDDEKILCRDCITAAVVRAFESLITTLDLAVEAVRAATERMKAQNAELRAQRERERARSKTGG